MGMLGSNFEVRKLIWHVYGSVCIAPHVRIMLEIWKSSSVLNLHIFTTYIYIYLSTIYISINTLLIQYYWYVVIDTLYLHLYTLWELFFVLTLRSTPLPSAQVTAPTSGISKVNIGRTFFFKLSGGPQMWTLEEWNFFIEYSTWKCSF